MAAKKKDKRVKVIIEFEQSTLWYLFNKAHRLDITLNELVNRILIAYIDNLEKKGVKPVKDSIRRRTRVR